MDADPTRNRHHKPRPGLSPAVLGAAHAANHGTAEAPSSIPPADKVTLPLPQLVGAMHQQARSIDQVLCRLVALLDPRVPAMQTVQLDATHVELQAQGTAEFKSLGIYTPSDATIYVGLGGDPARPGVGALQVPARSAVVLPVAGELVSLGAAAADLTVPAIVYVFRYATVQPLSLGAVA